MFLFNLDPNELALVGFLVGFAIAQENLSIEEQFIISSFLALIGQTLSTIATQRVLLKVLQQTDDQDQTKKLLEQIKQLQIEIDQLKGKKND